VFKLKSENGKSFCWKAERKLLSDLSPTLDRTFTASPQIQLSLQLFLPSKTMASSPNTNLDEFEDIACALDQERSEIRTLPGHQVSFCLPAWHDQDPDTFDPVILRGETIYLQFGLGDESDKFSMGKTVSLHGELYNLPKEAKAIHERGLLEIKRFQLNNGRTIVGAEPCRLPKVLFLEYVHVRLHTQHTLDGHDKLKVAKLQTLVDRINARAVDRKLEIEIMGQSLIMIVPGSWIVQDLTAIDQHNRRLLDTPNGKPSKGNGKVTKAKEETENDGKDVSPEAVEAIQVIKYPLAFPALGSKIVYKTEGAVARAVIKDFDIVGNGSRIEVLCHREDNPSAREFLMYSRLYASSEETMLNPSIIKVNSPSKYKKIKDTYLNESREYFVRRLGKWNVWKICQGKNGYRVLASIKNEAREDGGKKGKEVKNGKDTKKGGRDEKSPKKNHWLPPAQAIERDDLNITSFETGSVTLADGTPLRVVYKEHVDPVEEEETIYLHDIPEDATINSLVFNAVSAHAETNIGGKRVEVFFSTKFAEDISVQSDPLFEPRPCTDRSVVDVISLKWVLGYAAKSRETSHSEQTVVYWAAVPEAFRNFYIWVIRMGNHGIFRNKTVSQVRLMFECEEYPCLVEMYNFLLYGYGAENPTRDSRWTHWFLQDIMCIDPKDLL
jgi:hypothetical protein